MNKQVTIQPIDSQWLQQRQVQLDVLRLDLLHPVVSGNKWFKLHYYLQEAKIKKYNTVATFGGAYSNHIVATAFACREAGLNSIGIIRGEKPKIVSQTLAQAQLYGMQFHFVSREQYRDKEGIKKIYNHAYWINDGGYGMQGSRGAAAILQLVLQLKKYTHIVCAVGTGTTLAGVVQSALQHQSIIGISVMKNNFALEDDIKKLLPSGKPYPLFIINHDYHFGGYAKHPPALLQYMNEVWNEHRLPTDMIYTAKAFYAMQQLVEQQQIVSGSHILFIHTGGLQGNLSLPDGVLAF